MDLRLENDLAVAALLLNVIAPRLLRACGVNEADALAKEIEGVACATLSDLVRVRNWLRASRATHPLTRYVVREVLNCLYAVAVGASYNASIHYALGLFVGGPVVRELIGSTEVIQISQMISERNIDFITAAALLAEKT